MRILPDGAVLLGRGIEVAVRHRIGSLALDVSFRLTESWTVLFAPSGAGKSTALRVIAGLVRPDWGRVVAGGSTVLIDTDADVYVPAYQRGVRLVGQQAGLFPHRTVRENVAYGGGGLVNEVMELCRVTLLAAKMPAALSGGERQRVALARALAAMPARLMLLDEPFSGLDVALRQELVSDVRAWLAARNVPVLQVTHDIGEVFSLNAEVVRMQSGRVIAQGPAGDVLSVERQWLSAKLGA